MVHAVEVPDFAHEQLVRPWVLVKLSRVHLLDRDLLAEVGCLEDVAFAALQGGGQGARSASVAALARPLSPEQCLSKTRLSRGFGEVFFASTVQSSPLDLSLFFSATLLSLTHTHTHSLSLSKLDSLLVLCHFALQPAGVGLSSPTLLSSRVLGSGGIWQLYQPPWEAGANRANRAGSERRGRGWTRPRM